jgi:hypothetical protein
MSAAGPPFSRISLATLRMLSRPGGMFDASMISFRSVRAE